MDTNCDTQFYCCRIYNENSVSNHCKKVKTHEGNQCYNFTLQTADGWTEYFKEFEVKVTTIGYSLVFILLVVAVAQAVIFLGDKK